VELLRELDDKDELADALTVLAATEFYLGNYEDADQLLRECLRIREESGKQWELAWTSYWLGRASNALGKYEEAEHILQDVIVIQQQIDEQLDRADAQIVLGLVKSKLGCRKGGARSRRLPASQVAFPRSFADCIGYAICSPSAGFPGRNR
jgi:tetratricopeptide (TPR) repeat protein